MTVTVVLNEWRGFPSALRTNLLNRHRDWATDVRDDVVLESTDPVESFERAVAAGGDGATVFHVARSRGAETVLLGEVPTHWRADASTPAVHADTVRLPDSRCDLHEYGVNRCSLHVPSSTHVASMEAYDEDACARACDVLRDFAGDALVLWVNLSAFGDLERVTFAPPERTPTTHSVCVAPPPPAYDRRRLPSNVNTYLEGISSATRRPEQEYVTLLHAAQELCDRHLERVERVVRQALERGAHVVHTATHSLAVGEHAVRGGGRPLATCCETFWASNRDDASSACLRTDLWRAVVAAGPPPPFPPSREPRETRCGDLTRVVLAIHDHVYACVFRDDALLFVFDRSVDPEESRDVLVAVSHLHPKMTRRAVREEPTETRRRRTRAPQPPPPPPSPPPRDDVAPPRSPSTDSVTTATDAPPPPSPFPVPTLARQASFSRRPARPTTTATRTNVRQTEARLHKMHR